MPTSVEIAGRLKDLEFPPLCANCGNATSESLEVVKVFRRIDESGDSSPDRFVIERVPVPFCPPCTAQHQSEARQVAPFPRFLMACRSRFALGVPAFAVLALLVLYMGARSVSPGIILWSMAALFGFLAWASYRAAYRDTEHLAIPAPTSITSAFDFTDDRSKLFEREHCTVTLRNAVFAEAFLARNPSRVWTAEDQAKSKAGWRRFFQ